MFQRSVIVNSLLASKKLNVILFNFIWNSKVEPIARSTLNIDRDKGGLSVFNILVKSECLFACRMLKQFLGNEDQTSLIAYYNAIRLNPLVNINTLPRNVSFTSTPFYDKGIFTIRKCLKN